MKVLINQPVDFHNGMYFEGDTAFIGPSAILKNSIHTAFRVVKIISQSSTRVVVDVYYAQYTLKGKGYKATGKYAARHTIIDKNGKPEFEDLPEPLEHPEWLKKIKGVKSFPTNFHNLP